MSNFSFCNNVFNVIQLFKAFIEKLFKFDRMFSNSCAAELFYVTKGLKLRVAVHYEIIPYTDEL